MDITSFPGETRNGFNDDDAAGTELQKPRQCFGIRKVRQGNVRGSELDCFQYRCWLSKEKKGCGRIFSTYDEFSGHIGIVLAFPDRKHKSKWWDSTKCQALCTVCKVAISRNCISELRRHLKTKLHHNSGLSSSEVTSAARKSKSDNRSVGSPSIYECYPSMKTGLPARRRCFDEVINVHNEIRPVISGSPATKEADALSQVPPLPATFSPALQRELALGGNSIYGGGYPSGDIETCTVF